MSDEDPRGVVAEYWMDKAEQALASARDETASGRLSFAVNRSYYAAFYAASAVLLTRGHRFVKHTGVRAAIHQHLVNPGHLDPDLGKLYDRLFHDRQEGDYVEFTHFEPDDAKRAADDAERLVAALRALL
jgi:uncharacterized protein (UPF0332 family)